REPRKRNRLPVGIYVGSRDVGLRPGGRELQKGDYVRQFLRRVVGQGRRMVPFFVPLHGNDLIVVQRAQRRRDVIEIPILRLVPVFLLQNGREAGGLGLDAD